MNLHTYDPREPIRGIHQILISDKKRIGFLFGAGSSFATGIPTIRVPAIADMTTKIVAGVEAQSTEFATAVKGIRGEIESGQHWWELDFTAFRAEVKKLFKNDIPLSERSDWESYFNTQRDIINNLTAQIELHEAAINRAVYVLFNLTPDEITLIELS
jgi:hypothetical protein